MGKKYSILFDSYHLYHLPQFEPLIDLLENDGRFEIYHSTSREIKKEEYELTKSVLINKPGKFISGATENERQGKIKDLDLDVFICGWSRYDIQNFVKQKTLVGMIYHGIGIKPSYWRDNHERLDIRFVEGPYRIDQLREKGIKTDLALTGFIKLDGLFQEDVIDVSFLKKRFSIDDNKKTILFAPTFYPSSVEPIGLRLGEYTRDYNLLIKPHLWTTFKNKFADVDHSVQRKLFSDLINKYDHIHLIPPEFYNITPFYMISDLLLTEASSTIYEMLALEKPVIVNRFFKLRLSHRIFKWRLYKRRLNQEMERDISDFCFEANNPDDLPKIIEYAMNNKKIKLKQMHQYKEKMLFKLDGNAAVRARDEILSRLKEN